MYILKCKISRRNNDNFAREMKNFQGFKVKAFCALSFFEFCNNFDITHEDFPLNFKLDYHIEYLQNSMARIYVEIS